ncbi:MAG TPA: hypothetical protein VNS81_08205 [Nocardioides sp.]|nr:hypothetical protein [Nocardioides sp.]
MMLWLTEAGKPAGSHVWQDMFDAANERLLAAYERLGALEPLPDVNAHMLRFSFALWVLIAYHKRIDSEMGYSPYDSYDPNRYGAAYYAVQVLLNHASEETTINTYLEPMKGLRQLRAPIFDEAIGMDLDDLIGHLTRNSDRIVRVDAGGDSL